MDGGISAVVIWYDISLHGIRAFASPPSLQCRCRSVLSMQRELFGHENVHGCRFQLDDNVPIFGPRLKETCFRG